MYTHTHTLTRSHKYGWSIITQPRRRYETMEDLSVQQSTESAEKNNNASHAGLKRQFTQSSRFYLRFSA